MPRDRLPRSHIFCLECWSSHGKAHGSQSRKLSCPACSTPLVIVDDAVMTNLVPSEDYKSSVLSGPSSSVVMDIDRALAFWTYRKHQKLCASQFSTSIIVGKHLLTKQRGSVYRDHMHLSLAEKLAQFEANTERAVAEIQRL